MSLKICSSYNCSITFTIYKSVHFYSTVITITSCHILSFSQVLPGIKKDSFAYADFPCIFFTLFFAFFFWHLKLVAAGVSGLNQSSETVQEIPDVLLDGYLV